MDADLAALTELVGDVDHFARSCWGRRALHRPSGRSFDHLISIELIETLLASGARRPTFRLVREGTTLPAERSTRPMRLGGRDLDDVADVAAIADAMHDGATLVVQSLQRTVPAIAAYCRSLERATSHPVQANAYLSPAGATGLSSHRDAHDVLVLQVTGTKRWTVEGLGPIDVAPGDVLYIPGGALHAATAQDAPTLHLTIGVLSVTYETVLRRMLEHLDEADLRRPLPLGYARGEPVELTEQLAERVRAATDALSRASVADVARAEAARARRRRRPLPSGHLRAVLDLERLELSDRVRWRADAPAELEGPDAVSGRVSLRLAGTRLTFPGAMRPALEALLAGEEIAVGQLPELSDVSRLVLARRLVREMVLSVSPPPAAADEGGRS